MRLWNISPIYLDGKGLVACWREGLLAQKVLKDKRRYSVSGYLPAKFSHKKGYWHPKGYWHHPELKRFEEYKNPVGVLAGWLWIICAEGHARNYKFDESKISGESSQDSIFISEEQLEFEFEHLQEKLKTRDKDKYEMNAVQNLRIIKY